MRWDVHGERAVYDSEWLRVALTDVEIPGERRFEHHVVRVPHGATGAVVHDPARGVLLLWRHRFITDSWGWEVPAGRLDPGETPEQACAREVLEETGHRVESLTRLTDYFPMNGLSDADFHLYLASGAERVAEPTDPGEAERIEWVPVADVPDLLRSGQVSNGLSTTALLWCLAFGLLQ